MLFTFAVILAPGSQHVTADLITLYAAMAITSYTFHMVLIT